MTATETIKLNVLDKAQNYAKIYASLLSEEFQRKRAYASIIALYALVDALEKTDVNIQKSMTLFRNPRLNEQYEISDLYVNDWHVDVRVITDGEGVLIPKIHFESNLLADFYAVIKVDKTLQTAELLGFVDSSKIDAHPFDDKYNSVLLSSLITYGEFLLKVSYEKETSFTEEDHEFFHNSYLSLMDDEIDLKTKNKLLSHLFQCNVCRTEFCCFTGFEMVSSNSSKYDDLLTDKTLEVIGANSVEDEKYQGKEETIYFDENEQKSIEQEAKKEETTEETVSDILDELFGIDETTEEPEVEEKTIETNLEITEDQEPINEITTTQDFEEIKEIENISEIEEIKEIDDIEEIKDIDDLDDVMNTPPISLISDEKEIQNTIPETKPEVISTVSENLEFIEETNHEDINIIDEIPNKEATQLESAPEPDLEIHEHNEEEAFLGQINLIEEDNLEIHDEKEDEAEDLIFDDKDEVENITIVEENEDTELEFHKDDDIDEYKVHNAEPAPQQSPNNVQKVIVDYDESGEPIYSYINGVDTTSPNLETEVSEIENIDDDVLNEKFETYEEVDEISSMSINNGATRPIQYIENTEDILLDEDNSSNIEGIEDIDQTEEYFDDTTIVNTQDYDADINNSSDETEEEIINFDTEETIENENNNETYEEENSEYEEEYENEEEETVDEDSEDSESEEDGEEYEDEDGEYEDDEYEDEEETSSKSKLPIVIALIVTLLVIAGSGVGAFMFFKNKSSNTTANETQIPENNVQENQMVGMEIPNNDMFGEPQNSPQPEEVQGELVVPENNQELPPPPPPQEENPVPPLTEADLIPPVNKESTSDPNQAITNAFANNGTAITITNINWLCSRELFANKTFNNYLQKLDNMLKLNLRKNILDANEKPKTNMVSVKMAVDNMGNLLKVVISDSSGSQIIDDIVLRSLNETFEGEKSQILNGDRLQADKYYLKVVIKL